MYNRLFKIACVAFLWFTTTTPADEKIVIDSLCVSDGVLVLNFHVQGLLDDKFIDGLKNGLTSQIVHQIGLWRDRTLFNSLPVELFYGVKVYFDNFEKKFMIVTETERRLTASVETLRDFCCHVKDFPLISVAAIDANSKYYLSINSTLQPVSSETIEGLSGWLSGQPPSESAEPRKSKRRRIWGVLVSMLGFGDKTISVKSRDFYVRNNEIIEYAH